MYGNRSMFSVLLVVRFLCLHESHCSLYNPIRFYDNGLKPRYWMVNSKILQWVGEEDSKFAKAL